MPAPVRMKPMGDYFTQWGSDKNTAHKYGPMYESLFPSRESVKSVLEIGIASGQSVRAWLDIFPKAQIVGIDKEPCHNGVVGSTDYRVYPPVPRPDRLTIHQADLRDRAGLLKAVEGQQFDLIVEDSSHVLDDNLRTLFLLWPHVKAGGLYVIEEMDNVLSWGANLTIFTGVNVLRSGSDVLVTLRKP